LPAGPDRAAGRVRSERPIRAADECAAVLSQRRIARHGLCEQQIHGQRDQPVTYTSLTQFLADTNVSGTFSRSSIATYFDSTGVLQTASANVPRLDYDPASHAARGILIEEARTNVVSSSNDWTTFTQLNATISPSVALSPDGAANATKLVPDTTGLSHAIVVPGVGIGSGVSYTASFFAKAGEDGYVYSGVNSVGASVVNLSNCQITYSDAGPTYYSASVGNGWCRITEIYVGNGNGFKIYPAKASTYSGFTGNGSDGIYVYGLQIEQGTFPTSYIPTTGTPVTRQNDTFRIATGGWWNATTGTFLSWSYGQKNTNQTYYGRIVSGDGAKTYAGFWGTLGSANPWNNTSQYSINGTVTASLTTPVKMAFAWDQNSATATVAMSSGQIDSNAWNAAHNSFSSTYGGDWTTSYIYLGNSGGNFDPLNTSILRVTYFPTRQPDAALRDYTR